MQGVAHVSLYVQESGQIGHDLGNAINDEANEHENEEDPRLEVIDLWLPNVVSIFSRHV